MIPTRDIIEQNGYSFDIEKGFYSKKSGKYLKISYCKKGYPRIWLYLNNKRSEIKIHRYVCRNYNGLAPINKPNVNHIDGNKMNWHPGNLEWVSHKENMAHAVKLGLHKTGKHKAKGEDNNMSKLTVEIVKKIRSYSGEISQVEIAKMFNVSRALVSLIINRKRWAHC